MEINIHATKCFSKTKCKFKEIISKSRIHWILCSEDDKLSTVLKFNRDVMVYSSRTSTTHNDTANMLLVCFIYIHINNAGMLTLFYKHKVQLRMMGLGLYQHV